MKTILLALILAGLLLSACGAPKTSCELVREEHAQALSQLSAARTLGLGGQEFIDAYGPGTPLFEQEVKAIRECEKLGR